MHNLSVWCKSKSALLASFLLVFSTVLPSQDSHAQSSEPENLARVLTAINALMMAGGAPVALTLGQIVQKNLGFQYGTNDHLEGVELNFQGRDEDVSICFGTVDIEPGEVSLEINSEPVIDNIVSGGHCILVPGIASAQSVKQVAGGNSVKLIQNFPGERWGVSNIGLELATSPPINPVSLSLGGNVGQASDNGSDPDGLNLTFSGEGEDVSLCFYTSIVPQGTVSIELNGIQVGTLRTGENCIDVAAIGAADRIRLRPGSNTLSLVQVGSGEQLSIVNIELDLSYVGILGLERATRAEWDEAAVRKVLRIFALGGHALDSQISAWADMVPQVAIAEMLTFDKQNLLLSPQVSGETYVTTTDQQRTFTGFSEYLSSDTSTLPISTSGSNRSRFGIESYDRSGAFVRMVNTRGLNPFRQRIGLWETNYHLAVNLDSSVDHRQLVKYYDVIMDAHESGVPYKDVLGAAAKSAAIARQYGHNRNRWRNGQCQCNDDFAREIHQLFYGIFGDEDPENTLPGVNDHHEDVTIPQTARLLTDMPVNNVTVPDGMGGTREISGDVVTFGTSDHHTADVYVLNTYISGADASQKIDNLMNVSIEHPEALKNLPVMIISGLADDNLTEVKAASLRQAWAAMGNDKNFLEFIRAYAVSDMFHSPTQRKYMTTFERGLFMANKIYQSNTEALLDISRFGGQYDDENAELFRPAHNVFGGQTSLEAADSATIFEESYNRSTDGSWSFYGRYGTNCTDCDFGGPWLKDWAAVIPTTNGNYVVEDVAKWLWNHVLGSLDNYGPAERAYLLPILGTWRLDPGDPNDHEEDFFDLNHLLCVKVDMLNQDPQADVSLSSLLEYNGYGRNCAPAVTSTDIFHLERIYSESQLDSAALVTTLLDEIGAQHLSLDSAVPQERIFANERIQWAMAFIFATPYIYAEERK